MNNKKKKLPVENIISVSHGKFRTTDFEEERKKPVFMTIDEFSAKIEGYSIDDYYSRDEDPYYDLLEASRRQVGLYDQYTAVMLDSVKRKSDDNKDIISYVSRKIEQKKWEYLLGTNEPNTVIEYIDAVCKDTDNADKVSVLPLMCGSGKSTALTFQIMNTIMRIERALDSETAESEAEFYPEVTEKDYDGLLIVTDSKERLWKLWNPDPDNKYISERDRQFITEHSRNWVSVMTEENYLEEDRRQRYVPVLCITTQRYFGWKREEILDHLVWIKDECPHKRSLIIFDEQPYLNVIQDISVNTINDIDTALRTCLDDEVDREDKEWCCKQWNMFRDWFFGLLSHYEYDFDGLDTMYFTPEKNNITEDDAKFFGIIETHRKKIRTKDNDSYNNLYVVRQWLNTWSIFNHRDIITGDYTNKFTVFIDNRDKVTNLGAKVIVLDGTGDVSPIYAGQDYIHHCNGGNFLRSLSYLTIKHGIIGTSKEDFRVNGRNIAKAILAYLKQQGYEKKDMVFFTYKGKDNIFQARVNGKKIANVAHFGDIRGKNDFTQKCFFSQVGMNQLQPVQYLVHVLARNDDMREDLARRDPENMYEQIQAIYMDDRYTEFATAHILADIDQCMFRSAIRNSDNLDKVIYYIFYKCSQKLREAIENRYKTQLGANIETISEADILDAVGAGKAAWRIRQWVATWDGKPIKQADLLLLLDIGRDSFNTALKRDPELKSWMKAFSKTSKEIGYKGRATWYAMNCVQE